MNYDVDTSDGMKNAVRWTEGMIGQIKEGGFWLIPRSGTVVRVSHKSKTVSIMTGMYPEASLRRVIKAMGWTIN